jgi:iron complex outermembrane receptor protein
MVVKSIVVTGSMVFHGNRLRFAWALTASVSCIALITPGQAAAQSATTSESTLGVQADGHSVASADTTRAGGAIANQLTDPPAQQNAEPAAAPSSEEIIVTGQRRAQALVDVPVTINVVDQETLTNAAITDTRALGQVIPGLVVTQKGSFVQPVVRGVSAQGTGPGLENSVPLYFDGIYMSDQLANLYDLSDIKSIELLKGPQGTLYGRNAVGGAILITTHDPEMNRTSGKASLGYGSFNDFRANALLNVPVADTLAVSLSGLYHSNDGYYRNILRGGARDVGLESWALHGKIRWEISPQASVVASLMYIESSDGSGLAGPALNNNTAARRIDPNVILPKSVWEYAHNVHPEQRAKVLLGYLRSEVSLGGGTWTMLGSYRRNRVQIFSDADYSPVSIQEFHLTVPSESFSFETFYVSPDWGPVSIVAGANYYEADERYEPLDLTFRPAISAEVNPIKMYVFGQQKTRSAAVYGEATISFTDELKLVVGARYTDEKKIYNAQRFMGAIPAGGTTWPRINDLTYNDFTPRASLMYKLARNTSLYATFSKGFKSGGFNPSTVSPDFVRPEKITAYEGGFKTNGRWGALNISGFHYDYEDMQVATIIGAVSATRNAAAAKFDGVDVDGSLHIAGGLRLTAGYSFVDAKYSDYQDAVANIPVAGGGNVGAIIDASGNPVIRAPKHTGNVGVEFNTSAFNGDLTLSGNFYFSSGFSWEPGNRIRQQPYQTLSAKASWRPADSRFQVAAWVSNITNEKFIQSESDSSAADGVSYAPPRWAGVSVSFDF